VNGSGVNQFFIALLWVTGVAALSSVVGWVFKSLLQRWESSVTDELEKHGW
jgi:hypothetical protein